MRELNDHKVNPANDVLHVAATDKPGSGGACHRYEVRGFATERNPGREPESDAELVILFQNGPISEAGINGVTHEVLIAILCDRLRGFQSGTYNSTDNAEALAGLEQAQTALQRRTRVRMARGVEGTHIV